MRKSYFAKTTINFVDFEFYVRPGDVLVHDTANHRLTVQRNGQIVKIVKQGPLAIGAFLKNKFIEEDTSKAAPPVAEVHKATPVQVKPSEAAPEPVKATSPAPTKRDKMVPKEVLISDSPRLMEALGLNNKETSEEPVPAER